jgi:hypothetical protein
MPREEGDVVKLLLEIVQVNIKHRIVAYIELVTGYIKIDKDEEERENRQPAHQMFKFGRGVGVLVGALKMVGLEPREVSPRTWQKPFYVNLSKPDAQRKSRSERKRILRDVAQRRFPQIEVTLKTADALLIHAYASMMEGQELEGLACEEKVSLPIPFTEKHTEQFSALKQAVAKVPVNGTKDLSVPVLAESPKLPKDSNHAEDKRQARESTDPERPTDIGAPESRGGQNSFYIIDWKGSPYVVAPDQDGALRMIRQASNVDVANLSKLPSGIEI